jgi:hypothetical protein
MKIYFLILAIILGNLVLTESAITADQSPGVNGARWGISTKVPVEEAETKNEDTEKEADLKNNLDDEKDLGDAATEDNDDADTKDITKAKQNVETKSIDNKQSNTTTPDKSNGNAKKNPWENSRKQKEKETIIKWENEAHKTKCKAYLASLRESFLKARYYSIQGVPCDTAENAWSFMILIDQCKRDCPDQFLKKNGYTARIIRNLSWLEKLGSERCPEMTSD